MFFSTRQTYLILLIAATVLSISYGEVCPAAATKEWTYRRDLANGPSHWGGNCNTGHMQSPIDIITSKLSPPEKSQIMMLKNFDKPIENVRIKNFGPYFSVFANDGVDRALVYEGHEYPLQQFHFHFGNTSENRGSEHTIDGKRFPFEAHFLFLFPDNTFFQVSSIFELNDEINPALSNILSVEPSFRYEGDQFEGKIQRDDPDPRKQGNIYLDDILNLNCPYYRYTGSNSIPPCPEEVPWHVCKTHKRIHNSQLMKFLSLRTVAKDEDTKDDCLMFNNNRPLQGSGDNRVVYG